MPAATPDTRFRQLLRVAQVDGITLVAVAGAAALGGVAGREWASASIGLGVAACGGLELLGRRFLVRRADAGITCLWLAQLLCLVLILAYAWTLARQDNTDHLLRLLPSFTRAQLAELFPYPGEVESLLAGLQRLLAAAVAVAALLYQGGMAFYYLRARRTVATVLGTPPLLPR